MVECQTQRQHAPDNDFIVLDNRLLEDSAYAEDSTLRRVDNRREGINPEVAEVRESESAALQFAGS